MSENYIVINGKKAELTPEQLKALGLEKETNSFKREIGKKYWMILGDGYVESFIDNEDDSDDEFYEVANYCTDREMMEQRALHETLDRLLWRYSMEHKGNDIDLSVPGWFYWIGYNATDKIFKVYNSYDVRGFGKVYFRTDEIARNAIAEIIKPFMEEHPDFKL